jgi:hypothetical protein
MPPRYYVKVPIAPLVNGVTNMSHVCQRTLDRQSWSNIAIASHHTKDQSTWGRPRDSGASCDVVVFFCSPWHLDDVMVLMPWGALE